MFSAGVLRLLLRHICVCVCGRFAGWPRFGDVLEDSEKEVRPSIFFFFSVTASTAF